MGWPGPLLPLTVALPRLLEKVGVDEYGLIVRHGDMDGYARAKQAIFARQGAADTAVLGIDDSRSQDMVAALRGHPARVVTISGGESADVSVQSGGVGPELDEYVGLLLGQHLDFADVDRRRAQLEHVEP